VSPRHSIIHTAVRRLLAGGVVAFPTETVYGLGADASNAAAIQRIYDLKGRPPQNPLIVHVADESMARQVVADWPDTASKLAQALWPGPLSLVLPKSDAIPPIVTAGGPNVAVRCPDHPLTLELLRQLGRPLVGPSANLSGTISPTTAQHVALAFSTDDVLTLDGGKCKAGIESTVLLLTEHPPRIARPGLISAEQISSILHAPVADFIPGLTSLANGPGAPALESPGQLEKHYAPRTPARLVSAASLPAALREYARCVVITHVPVPVPAPHAIEPLPHDALGYAAGLYAALRSADQREAVAILIVQPQPPEGSKHPGIWAAIADRLHRATA
jgi:L-threonylcarbamoyladenylate synthase